MKNLKCIIVDDEPIAIEYLKDYVEQMPGLELVASVNRATKAYEILANEKVDLIFLDIQMPGLTGLDFIRTLPQKPAIILTTAYSEYALEGFNLDVNDYLLKPFSFERFAQAVLKVSKQFNQQHTPIEQENKRDFIFLKSGYKSIKVNITEITHVEGMKEYVVFYTLDGKKYIKNDRMKNVEELLSSHNFIRVHKSYLVSIDHISSFYGNTIEITNTQIPVGRVYKEELKKLFEG
ncbi:response regulator transcription factor [Puteibacter caeruleilacunae]|nr:response regulator transcription factor [Puteibacter caeruleilacunae]